jgi:ComF family protein
MNYFSFFADAFLDLIYPRTCLQCNEKLSDGEKYFCQQCRLKIRYIDINDLPKQYKSRFSESSCMEGLISLFYFDAESTSQKIIHSIKYDGMKTLGIIMGKSLGEKIFHFDEKYDCIIPVPLHKGRERERGFNQSAIISEGLSSVLSIPVELKILIRSRYTESQTKFSREGRIKNVEQAFKINPKMIEKITGKNILLLDDVITTGSTMDSCAKALKENGAKKIIVVSLALVENTTINS